MRTGKTLLAGAASLALAALAPHSPARAALTIAKAATSNVTCAGGVCTATASDAVLDVDTLKRALRDGDLAVKSGAQAQDIVFAAEFSWTAATRLTLDSFRGIEFRKPLTAEGTGAVTLATNDGGGGGDLRFTDPGRVAFWDMTSSLIINGKTYTLAADLATLAANVQSAPRAHHALAANIDAAADGTYAQSPIPGAFYGVFEGLGHKVANVTIVAPERNKFHYAGLFAKLQNGGVMRDLNMVNFQGSSLKAKKGHTTIWGMAPVVGDVEDSSVLNCTASGHIALQNVDSGGGLVGFAKNATIANSSASTTLAGTGGMQGGLVAELAGGTLVGSHASGEIVLTGSNGESGGLIGWSNGTIRNSSATGAVSGLYSVGGLIGFFASGGLIDSSFATGSVNGQGGNVGGLVGASDSKIVNSYATGAVSDDAAQGAGGLVGMQDKSVIASSYAIGHVDGGTGPTGGVIGVDAKRNGNQITNTYWDLDTSGVSDPSRGAGNRPDDPGLTGLTTAQFTSGLPAGFDPAVWGWQAGFNLEYPYLLANPPQ
ncbi:MAG TPA: hypothetical protein VG889_17455 [Rhizomicrobium sp.]|nr:hypothetical protein [Rhizomicrobium sp.]